MTANTTGRTVSRWTKFLVNDTGSTLREIPVSTISAVGVTFDTTDLTALQDAVKGALPNMPDAPISISGPLDIDAAAAAPTLSGAHTILAPLNATNAAGTAVPLTIDIRFGMRHTWESGEPVFGITSSATSGYMITSYTVDPVASTYSATFVLWPGSALPAFGTTANT